MKQPYHFNYSGRIIKCNIPFIFDGLSNLSLLYNREWKHIRNYEIEIKNVVVNCGYTAEWRGGVVAAWLARALSRSTVIARSRARRLSEASAFDNACARTRVIKFIPFSPESA